MKFTLGHRMILSPEFPISHNINRARIWLMYSKLSPKRPDYFFLRVTQKVCSVCVIRDFKKNQGSFNVFETNFDESK